MELHDYGAEFTDKDRRVSMRIIDADALKKYVGTYDGTTAQVEAVEVQYIDNAPTIDDLSEYSDKLWKQAYERGKAERPQGEWINQSQGAKYPCECSECHTEPFCNDEGYVLSNFCPNCGADMRGGRE